MQKIIIYEDNIDYMEKNCNAVIDAYKKINIPYKIYKFTNYCNELDSLIYDNDNHKIYILDVETDSLTGLEVASRIREVDYESIIIFATAYDKYHEDIFYSRYMVLDFICKYDNYEERLSEGLIVASKIVNKQKIFEFKYNHIIHRVPYSHICYIEKEPLIKRCVIHTYNNRFYIVKTINELINSLDNDFIRVHQSCIVNKKNIRDVDCKNNIIYFKNGQSTKLLSDKYRKDLIHNDRFNN